MGAPRNPWSLWRALLWGQLLVSSGLFAFLCCFVSLPASLTINVLFFVLLVWQCEMLGFWAGLGQSPMRFFVIVPAAPAVGLMASYAAGGELRDFQVFCLGVFGIVTLTTLLLRRFAGSLHRMEQPGDGRDALRFGIQHVMGWTGLLAVLFSVFRYLASIGFGFGSVDGPPEIFALACAMSVSTVAAVWAILSKQILVSRLFGMVLATVFAVSLTRFMSDDWMFSLAVPASQVLVWLSLLWLRMDRFRFLKRTVE